MKEAVESVTGAKTEEATEGPEGREEIEETTTSAGNIVLKETVPANEASEETTSKIRDQEGAEPTTLSESKQNEPVVKGVDEEEVTTGSPAEETEITTMQGKVQKEILVNETSTSRSIGDSTTTIEKEETESKTTDHKEEMTTQQIEGREELGDEVTASTPTIYSGIETTRSLKIDATTLSPVAQTSEEETTLKPDTRNELPFETVTSSPILDLTTTKLIIMPESGDVLVVHATTSPDTEVEMTTLGYRIQEIVEGKEATTSKALEEEEGQKEFVMVEDEKEAKEAASRNQTFHTLKCHPTQDVASEPGTIPMECQDTASSVEPIFVVISSEGLDLDSISKKNIKIVVKEFMLMEMQQNQAPRRK